jgi:hypothetical protein
MTGFELGHRDNGYGAGFRGRLPAGLQDRSAGLIEWKEDSQARDNAVSVLTTNGATAVAMSGSAAAVDLIVESGHLAQLSKARKS